MVNYICNGRCYDHYFLLADVMPMVYMANLCQMSQMENHLGKCYGHKIYMQSVVDEIPLRQMLPPLSCVDKCGR